MRKFLLLLLLLLSGVPDAFAVLSVPNTFAGLSGNVAASKLDDNYTAIVNWINARNPTSGLLSARPAAGNAGALYAATDTGQFFLDNGSAWISAVTTTPPQALAGLGLANDSGAPNTVLDVAIGAATTDDTLASNRIVMTLASASSGSIGGTWVVGAGSYKMDQWCTGCLKSTWFNVFLIERTDTSVVDILFASPSSPTLPTSYTKKRRLGSFKTDGSGNILTFTQDGDYFRWKASVLDVSSNNPGTSAVTRTLASVPTGVNVHAIVNLAYATNSTIAAAYLSDLAANDEAASLTLAPLGTVTTQNTSTIGTGETTLRIRTNTSAQIRSRITFSDANANLFIATLGWWDRRGQDN